MDFSPRSFPARAAAQEGLRAEAEREPESPVRGKARVITGIP